MSTVIEINNDQVQPAVSEAKSFVLLYFWANWCGPCRLVSPSISGIAQDYGDRLTVLKMEVDANPETVKTYKVEGVPALRLLKDQTLIAVHEGAITKDQLKVFIESNLT